MQNGEAFIAHMRHGFITTVRISATIFQAKPDVLFFNFLSGKKFGLLPFIYSDNVFCLVDRLK